MKNKKILNSKRPAITLAEILIVVAIVAIIGSIFLAMPRNKVSLADRTKYYIAYTTIQRLLNEQMAEKGTISLTNAAKKVAEINCNEQADPDNCKQVTNLYDTDTFRNMVERWLNFVPDTIQVHKAELTNGISFNWGDNKNDITQYGIKTQKVVWVDLDGIENNKGRNLDLKDRHYFLLTRDGDNVVVKPVTQSSTNTDASNSSWITFRVFRIADNGDIQIILLGADYTSAYNCFTNANNVCQNKCSDGNCFMEPIPPMK